MRRVGHKGADLITPGNTHASFDAALAAGVDMIEFDVLPEEHGDGLLLAHDYLDAAARTPHTLDEGLAHLAGEAFSGIDIDVDLKLPGYEERVVQALREHPASGARTQVIEVFGQRKLLQWSVPGVAHFLTFWGFIILILTIIEAYGDLSDPRFKRRREMILERIARSPGWQDR